MKPLIRWIVGPVFPQGMKCLSRSYRKLRAIYGDSMDYLICHNQLTPSQREVVESIGCHTYEQTPDDFPVTPCYWPSDVGSMIGTRNCWKLHPPRMRLNSYEIILDNDIVITDRISTIDVFFGSTRPMLSQALQRNYGQFARNIPENFVLNSGVIGLPPGFDFQRKLLSFLPPNSEWSSFFDEQGLVVSSLVGEDPLVVGFDEIAICKPNDILPKAKGFHFVGLNSNQNHVAWSKYIQAKMI